MEKTYFGLGIRSYKIKILHLLATEIWEPFWILMKTRKETLRSVSCLLREDERKLIYQHVFEERTFDDMSRINGLSPYKVKGIYYYAIRKIRKWMGGAR